VIPTLPVRPFTDAWAAAFRDAVEEDLAYREAAQKWTWPVALVLQPTPHLGYPEAVAVELALDRGRCASAAIMPRAEVTAPFVLTAGYEVWKSVVRGELDPIVGVTRGKIQVQGSLATLMLHTKSASALVACARKVPTAFPDEE
jgi:putative sterol carrier protein